MEPQLNYQDAAKKIPLFSKVTLKDLLDVENRRQPAHPLVSTYLSNLTPVQHSIPSAPQPDSVILTPSFTTVLYSKLAIILYTQDHDFESTRVHLKSTDKEVLSYKIDSVYTIISLVQLWLKFKSDLSSLIKKLNHSSLSEDSAQELELFIYQKVGIGRVLSLKQELRHICRLPPPCTSTFEAQAKPTPDIDQRTLVPADSLSYTASEDTDQMEELNFRVSDLFRDKFPRFSAASITVMDTPGKEVRKSFLEYNEMIESPRCNLHNYSKTPLDSPKQASLTIDQVKERLESTSSPQYSCKAGTKFDFDSEVIKSLNTELTGCSELKPHMPFEAKSRSCQCSSCAVF